jgi:glutathione S-transferase
MYESIASVHEEKLRVHYFYIRGKCQPIRHLLYYLQVDFDDIMHEKSSEVEMEMGFNMGLPMLEDGNLKIHDAVAIMIYICRKFENNTLIGFTPQTIARVQEVLMKYSLQRNKIFGIIFESLRTLSKDDKETASENFFKKLLGECKLI